MKLFFHLRKTNFFFIPISQKFHHGCHSTWKVIKLKFDINCNACNADTSILFDHIRVKMKFFTWEFCACHVCISKNSQRFCFNFTKESWFFSIRGIAAHIIHPSNMVATHGHSCRAFFWRGVRVIRFSVF